MIEDGSLKDHLVVFKEIITVLKTLEVKHNEKDLTSILLCSLPILFRDTISYSRDRVIIEYVYDSLFSIKKIKHLVGSEAHGESPTIHGGYGRRWSKFKFNFSNHVCKYWKKMGHVKKNCNKFHSKEKLTVNHKAEKAIRYFR